ncbi:MAG TPA: polysaccharide biosynthesis C-terminal domain-containing protein, partial [Blastocatellia bacterium]|nr:polysaccharide biosynthesis C-terminal domain-containing protein [Blastocatellia bacterium]
AIVTARLVACGFYAIAARRGPSVLFKAKWEEICQVAKRAPTFAGITILSSLHWQLPTIMLGWIGSEVAAAEYGVASRFLVPSVVLLSSYSNALLPEVARLAAISSEAMGKFLSRGLQFVLCLALPFAVGAMLLSREALVWLFGARYSAASTALSLLAFTIIPLGLVMIVSRGLIANGYQRIDLLGNASAVVASVIFGWLLMPRYGATGAALAHLASMIVLVGVELIYASRRLFKLEMMRTVALCLVPLMAMSLTVWPMRSLGVLMAATVGAVVYLIGLWLMMRSPRGFMVGEDAANPG